MGRRVRDYLIFPAPSRRKRRLTSFVPVLSQYPLPPRKGKVHQRPSLSEGLDLIP